ncbi:MAG TPA: hypothetical protein VN915_07155 [Elusimicrobiota bacterium]|nr:hypothetical protein [Elusimicrobiota bacterium]
MIALANAHYGPLFGAESDAASFHSDAVAIASGGGFSFTIGSQLYTSMLAMAYSLVGPSHFFGEETSVLAYAFSCVVLVRTMDLLKIDRHRVACVLIFGLLPPAALYGSYTVREAWEILFFMYSVYSFLRFRLYAKPGAMLAGLLSACLMGSLHSGLALFAVILIPYALLARMGKSDSTLTLPKLFGLAITTVVLAGFCAAVLTHRLPRTSTLDRVADGEAMSYAADYREHSAQDARASYGVKLDSSSPIAFAASAPLVYIYYMLSPMPWQIRTGLDVYGELEAWFRILLLYFSLKSWLSRESESLSQVKGFLLTLFIAMSFLWSLGTINYGTATRHHLVPFWILVILGAPHMLDLMTRVSQVRKISAQVPAH